MQTWQNWSNDLRMIQFFFLRIEIRYYFLIFLALIFLSRNSADCAQVKVKPTSKNACRSGFCVMPPCHSFCCIAYDTYIFSVHFHPFSILTLNNMLSFFEARSRGCPFFTVFMDSKWCFVQSCRTSGVQLLRWDSKSAVRFEWKSKKNLTQLASKTREWQQGQKVQCKWKGSVSAHVSISFVFSCDFLILFDRANELSSPPAMLNVLMFCHSTVLCPRDLTHRIDASCGCWVAVFDLIGNVCLGWISWDLWPVDATCFGLVSMVISGDIWWFMAIWGSSLLLRWF